MQGWALGPSQGLDCVTGLLLWAEQVVGLEPVKARWLKQALSQHVK